jgi:hypothetical protein
MQSSPRSGLAWTRKNKGTRVLVASGANRHLVGPAPPSFPSVKGSRVKGSAMLAAGKARRESSAYGKVEFNHQGLHVAMGWGWGQPDQRHFRSGAQRVSMGNRPRLDGMRMMRFLVNNRFLPRIGWVSGPFVTVRWTGPSIFAWELFC